MSVDIDTILHGDALAMLRTLPDNSVHCCVTSPPYYGLRDYQTSRWDGGDPECEHELEGAARTPWANDVSGPNGRGKNLAETHWKAKYIGGFCRKCSAVRIDQQIGLEPTLEQYVARLVGVLEEVKRVLRNDGTLWLNLGDSYAGSWGIIAPGGIKGVQRSRTEEGKRWERKAYGDTTTKPATANVPGLKPKDLIGVPWRVAFALQAAGWWLRSDIIWAKKNCMPESVTDRPTRSHEYIFLLAKSERYYYDADAIREPAKWERWGAQTTLKRNPGTLSWLPDRAKDDLSQTARNKRTVWSIATQPYTGAHFATFPPKLIEPCILAGCPAGGVVLDPFFGSGTVGEVAIRHSRHYLGIELNPAYIHLAEERLGKGIQRVLWSAS